MPESDPDPLEAAMLASVVLSTLQRVNVAVFAFQFVEALSGCAVLSRHRIISPMTKESQLSVRVEFDEVTEGEDLEDLDELDDDYEDSYEDPEGFDDFRTNGEPDGPADLEQATNNSD